jgi:hypothetical protein
VIGGSVDGMAVAPVCLAMGRLATLTGDAWSSLRFAAGMAMMGGVFVFVQAFLLVEGLVAVEPDRPRAVR